MAFKVKHDSEFYAMYYEAKDERTKFKALAVPFFEKYGIDGRYYQTKSLAVDIPSEQRQRFAEHLRKQPDRQGFYWFKKKSPIGKEWEDTVTARVNFDRLEQTEFWWLPYISTGKYLLWDMDGEIYGYLESRGYGDIAPGDYMEPMKLSEYYAAVEKYEDRRKNDNA